MALTGTLETFGVAELLEALAAAGKTGCLSVSGDGGQGRVWVSHGSVAAGSTDRVADGPLDEVLCDLLRYETGDFSFAIDERSPTEPIDSLGPTDSLDPTDTAGVSLGELLDRAQEMVAEWRELERAVPSVSHWVRLAETLPAGEQVTIDAAQWHALAAIGDGCSVADLGERLALSELNILRTVHDLVTYGLAVVEPRRTPGRNRRPPRRPHS
jgi:hypothetical protein